MSQQFSEPSLSGREQDTFLDLGELGQLQFDETCEVVICSAFAREHFGVNQTQEVTRSQIVENLYQDDRANFLAFLEQSKTAGSRDGWIELRTVDTNGGSIRFIECRLRSFFDASGAFRGALGITRDVTVRKNVEVELRRAIELASAASAAKTQFVANMSHEMRTPLGAILGYADLASESACPHLIEESLSTIKRNGDQLLQIVNEVLDLAKVEAQKMEIEESRFDLVELLRDIEALFSLTAKSRGLELVFTNRSAVPRYLQSDRLRVRQILVNLIANALKFSSSGKVTVEVECSPPLKEGFLMNLKFSVTDTGIGICENHRDLLFKPFSQIDNGQTRNGIGTGLGLLLSKKIARALGGDVVLVRSQPGVGSTFAFCLPERLCSSETELIESLDVDLAPVKLPEIPVEKIDETLHGLRVLVADDSHDNRELLGRYLESAGVAVDHASNGEEALEKAADAEYDIVLMDLQMPIMNGHDAVAALRRSGYDRPVVALTAHAMSTEKNRCMREGFDDFLTKPITKASLMRELATLAQRRSLH